MHGVNIMTIPARWHYRFAAVLILLISIAFMGCAPQPLNLFTAVTVTRTFLHFIMMPVSDEVLSKRRWLLGL